MLQNPVLFSVYSITSVMRFVIKRYSLSGEKTESGVERVATGGNAWQRARAHSVLGNGWQRVATSLQTSKARRRKAKQSKAKQGKQSKAKQGKQSKMSKRVATGGNGYIA